jgi:H+-transporting ATPase
MVSSVGDLLLASFFAIAGIAMTPLPAMVVAGVLLAAVVFAVLVDFIKVPLFRRLRIS